MNYYEARFMLRTEVIMRALLAGESPELPRVVDAIICEETVLCKELMPDPFPLAIFNAIYEPTHLPSIADTH